MKRLNEMLSGRLYYMNRGFIEYGINLFGSPVSFILTGGDNYFYIDCSYINIAMRFGVIILIFTIIGIEVLLKRALNDRNMTLLLVIICICLHSITDPQLLSLAYNPFLMLIGIYMFKDTKQSFEHNMVA